MARSRNTADTQTASGGPVSPGMAGKNAIINGGMDIFQRTSFATYNAYSLDRWYINSSNNVTVTQSTAKITPNSQYMMLATASTTQQIFAYQVIETKNAIYYAGKTVTLSAYAAGLTTTTNLIMGLQYSTSVDVGMGGSWTDITVASGNANLTLSSTVTRWSAQYAVPSNAKSLRVLFVNNAANITVGQGIYLGDVQLEVGSVATPFSRAGGTIQGELAACQRYYWRMATGAANPLGNGSAYSGSQVQLIVQFPVTMRVGPALDMGTGTDYFTFVRNGGSDTFNSFTIDSPSTIATNIYNNTQISSTAGNGGVIFTNNASAYLGFTSEL
jgi:hypothetical protein